MQCPKCGCPDLTELSTPAPSGNTRYRCQNKECKHRTTNPEQDAKVTLSERQRMTDRIAQLQSDLKAALKKVNANEDIERQAMGFKDYPFDIPKWTLAPLKKDQHQEVPVLFTSDFQFGEVIDLDEMDGLNEYDVEIACARYESLIQKTVDLCFNFTARPNFPGLIYMRGGDAISGSIHDELAETDELTPPQAVVALAQVEIAGIEMLAEHFGRVHVISIPGNHDRSTKGKPRAKKYVANSYENMLSAMLQMWFDAKKDRRVTFFTPKSGDAYFPIWDWKCLLTHGDRMGTGGGMGFMGPIAPIVRGHQKIRQTYQQQNQRLDFIFNGHYHTACEVPGGLANGTLAGYNEYARKIRAMPDSPSQWLFAMHPEWGMTWRRKIYVESPAPITDAPWTAVPGKAQ